MPSKTYDLLTIKAAVAAPADYVAAYPAGGPLYAVSFAGFSASVAAQLALGTAAYASLGTAGASVPLLTGANAWAGPQTFRALAATAPASAAGAGLNLAPGVAPASPNDGDAWITATAVFARVGGQTQQLMAAQNDLADLASAAAARANLGVSATGADGAYCLRANNLADVGAASARANLGLGAAALAGVGTSGAVLGLLDADLGFSGANTHAGTETFAALVQTAASASAGAGLNLAPGAPPAAPADGDLWTTSAGLFARIAGATVGPMGAGGGGLSTAALLFGDGSDGNVTITGAVALTRDMFYQNLTLSPGAALNPAGWRIFVAGVLDLTAAPAGAIAMNGAPGGAAPSTASGGAATPYFPVNSLGADAAAVDQGLAGIAGATGSGAAGTQQLAYASLVNGGGSGGTGASGAGTNAGNSAISNSSNNVQTPTHLPFVAVQANSSGTTNAGFKGIAGGLGASSAASGGGDGANRGGASGGGGQGGGVIFIAAATLDRGASTAVAAIQAKGGSAGSGFAPAAGNSGGAGGSGGGGGGYIICMVGAFAGSVASNAIDISAGNGAAGTNANGIGIGGNGGSSGQGGRFTLADMSGGTMANTTGSPQVAGALHAGASAGAGGVASIDRAKL